MHADPVYQSGGDSLTQDETELLAELDAPGLPHAAHSLLAVLMPAHPPEPKNARVIRLFDVEASANDPAPAAVAEEAPAPQEGVAQATPGAAKPEPKSRDAVKAARNQSLFAAARLV